VGGGGENHIALMNLKTKRWKRCIF